MRVNFNIYNRIKQYRMNRPIRVVAEEVVEGATQKRKCPFQELDEHLTKLEKEMDSLAILFEQKTGVYRIEKEFEDGTQLLKTRLTKEEGATIPFAEIVD